MDRRCAAGALVALAACIATTAAAPTASNQTALDLYDGTKEGCYYNFQHYGEGDRIMTNEPCLNCTCHNRMLMCYLRVCPFTKPIGQDCSVEKRADQCCPIVTCPDVPVDLLTSTSTSSPSEYGETGIGKLDRYGCSINGKYFPEGSKVPPSPNKPCEHCYCIRNMTTCVMQECTLHVDGCTPIYRKDVCCPVRYSCDHPEDEIPLLDDMTTTVRPTPGFLLTTTTLSPVTQMTQDCVHDDKVFADGALIKTEKACEHCYCMKGDIVCVVQECGTPMENEGKNCTSMPPREGQCCPDTYICEGDELTTETQPEIATVTSFEDITTLSPPRRVSIEGSGYRSETDEPSTEVPTFEPDSEGSGEDQAPFKPTDTNDMLIPESETSPPFKSTSQDDIADKYYPSTTEVLETDKEMAERATTEADKGENTVPSGDIDEDTSKASVQYITSQEPEITTSKLEAATESSVDAKTTALPEDGTSGTDKTTALPEDGTSGTVKTTALPEDGTSGTDKTTALPEDGTSGTDKTTALPEDETSLRDKTTSHEEITATEPASITESTIGDHELNTSPGSRTSSEGEHAETTLPTRRKEDEKVPIEITTIRQLEETTTKVSDLIAPDTVVTESTTSSFLEHETETSASMLSEKDNEVTEPTTEVELELTTKSDVINTDNQSATTVQPEITTELSTPGKVDFTGTTSANPIENEIDEDSFPTLAPGRIPGEGDCLLDGVTYSHESIVPSRSNCHTSCRCISSIVKCEPIICSPPPDYMDNCQPMYDSPESCCPTYVCDHPKETVPPQSHSQMAGTESPIPTPTIECDGDQCEVVKDKEFAKPHVSCTSEGCTDDSSKKDVDNMDCGPQGCGEIQTKPEGSLPLEPAEECAGDSCLSPPVHCASGNCETSIPKDQTCNNENGCEIPAIQKCEGDNCAILPDITATKDDSTPCADPESCKDVQISDKPSECKGDTCILASPPQTIPQEKQDCKDDKNCVQQTPAVEECNEEDCKRQQVTEINKPLSSDCTGTECIQQPDNLPQITTVPEINTESASKVTGLPEEAGTKLQEPITDLPIQAETEPSATSKASISDKDEELGTTPEYDESVINKEKEPEPNVPESPEIVTPEGQPQESFTESVIDKETTMVPLQDITKVKEIIPEVTIALSEAPTTEISSLPDKDSMEITTELPSVVDTKTPESMTNTDNANTETSIAEDTAKDKDTLDIATTEPSVPAIYSTSSDINMETTESQEILTMAPESLDKDGHEEMTKEPEYVQDTESKASEPTERYTSTPDQITDKVEVETTDGQELQDTPTTPKSYENQPNMPGALETEEPTEEVLHSSTSVPETQTTSPQEDKKESEIPVFTLTSEEPLTDKPDKTMDTAVDMSSPDNNAETKSPVDVNETTAKPEMVFDGSETQSPELNVTPGEESITKAPGYETEIQTESSKPLVTLPQETATDKSDTVEKDIETPAPVTVNVQTVTPMSIVKDHGDDEISSTITPESEMTTVRDVTATKDDSTPCADPESCKDVQIYDKPYECKGDSCITASFTKYPESPESEQSTESIAKPTESPSENPVSEFEKMPSVSDVEHAAATTEKSGADLETTKSAVMEEVLPTKQPVHDSEMTAVPETEASTDSTSVSVPIIIETISSEPSVTEANIQKSSAPQEETSESAPITSMPGEDIETKLPVPVTESSVQPISEGEETITPTQEQSNENTDATELPELVIHEHPTEPSSIINESGQLATEDTATNQPDMAVKEQDITPEKDTSDAPAPLDNLTVTPETPTSEIEKEVTVISEQESVTKMTEFSQSETTESKPDDLYHIPELSPTESQKEVTEGPDSQTITTNAPEIAVTDAQKESTEAPAIQTTVTSGTKISETEPQEIVTEGQEVQTIVTDADVLVTQPHGHTTDIPVSYDMITNAPDMDTEPDKESTDKPKESDTEPHKETTGIHDITTTIPEMSPTEVHKEPTETPDLHDTAPKDSDISPAESDKEGIEEPELQNVMTSVPIISSIEPQEETTTVPKAEDMAPIIPESSETEPEKDVTEYSVVHDLTTSSPAVTVTEIVPLEDTIRPMVQNKATTVPDIYVTESQKEGTETPTHDDTFTNVPDGHATESQKEGTETPTHDDTSTNVPGGHATESQKDVTDSSAAQDTVTNVPDTLITESQKDKQSPEPEYASTSAPELPETEPKKETTETPAQEAGSTIPDISETEPKKEITDMPEIQVVTDAPEMPDDSKAPTTTATESPGEVTNVSEAQDAATNAPELQTESQKEVTDIPETSEKTVTEPHDVPTEQTQNTVGDLSDVLTTESQKEATEIPDTPMMTSSNAPETLATKSDKDVTDAPEPVTGEVTKTPELVHTEATGNEGETEKPPVTEKDEIFTETPLKVTKFDDHTQSEPQGFITSTESSDPSQPTESGLPVEQFTKVTETLVTESPDKATGSDSDIDKPSTGMPADEKKPQDGQEINTETPVVEPAKTESPISPESIKPETKAPELMDSETGTTIAPELSVTENQEHTNAPESEPQGSRRTEATSAPIEEVDVVTKAPQTLEPQDKTTNISEEPEQTSEPKKEYPETTPYLVLLEEHTHKTVSPDEDITSSPSDVPLKEDEPSTPEVTVDKVTEPAPSTETEKSPDDVISDKDQSVPELTQTTISENITESSLVSEEISTISPSPELIGTEKPQYVESNEISTSAPMADQEPSETEKPSIPSVEAETEKEVIVSSQKPPETTAPEEEFIYATTKATTIKEEPTPISPLDDKFGKPDDAPKPAESEKQKPDTSEEVPKPGANVVPTEEAIQPGEESHFPTSGTSGYGQEPDYGEEDTFGPGTCRYGGKVYVSAQQIPRDDPCDFCFCFRSDIICLQQSCPPPIHGCHEEPIQGFCCPRYECHVSMATTLNVTTTTTTTTTTLPPHFLPHAYKGAAQRRGCQIKGHTYKVGEVVRASSGPCLHCTCGGDGQMKCDPKVCTPEPMLRQMIAAAVSAKRRR